MVMIEHPYMGDEKISRTEILTILAVTMTQLEHEYLEEHAVEHVEEIFTHYLGTQYLLEKEKVRHLIDSHIKQSKRYILISPIHCVKKISPLVLIWQNSLTPSN
jgi:Archaeal adenylate kinase